MSYLEAMPKINLSELKGDALTHAKEITKKDGTLKASRPKKASGRAQYVWRMVAFQLSPRNAHQCMPVCADFYLYDDSDEGKAYGKLDFHAQRAVRKSLDTLADEICNTVPKNEWYGIRRWAAVLGR